MYGGKMAFVVIIMILASLITKYTAMFHSGRCIELCKETVSYRSLQFCHCETQYTNNLNLTGTDETSTIAVTIFRKSEMDALSCNQTAIFLKTCKVHFSSERKLCEVKISSNGSQELDFKCDSAKQATTGWVESESLSEDLVKVGCNTSSFKDDDSDWTNCLDTVTTVVGDKPSTSNWEPNYQARISNWTGNPLMYAVRQGRVELFNLLVRKSGDISSKLDENGDTILHLAAIGGSVDIAKHIISLGIVDIESKGCSGRTALMHAARHGHKEMFDLLVNHGCNLTSVDEDKANVLHMACIDGNLDIVKNIVTMNNIDIESKNVYKMTPLLLAAWNGHVEVFDYLLSNGSNLEAVNVIDENILHLASEGGRVEMARHIFSLNFGHEESRATGERLTPIMYAVTRDHIDMFDCLLKQGCDKTAVDDEENTILHMTSKAGLLEMLKHIFPLVSSLKEDKNYIKHTPLLSAVYAGHIQVFDYLVGQGCDKMAVDEERSNILHVACSGAHLNMVKYVYSLNLFDKEGTEQNGYTPILSAAFGGNVEVFKFLQNQGCKITVLTDFNANALYLASMRGHLDMVKYLMSLNIFDKDAKTNLGRTALMTAAMGGYAEIFYYLIDRGSNLGKTDTHGDTVAHLASFGGNSDIIHFIYSLKHFDKELKNNDGSTSLLFAASRGFMKIVDSLLDLGCNPKAVDNKQRNMLHHACGRNNVDLVKRILSMNAFDKDGKESKGRTPMFLAAWGGNRDVFFLLLNESCDANVVDNEGNNILHAACVGGKEEIVKYILDNKLVNKESRNFMKRTPLMLAARRGEAAAFFLMLNQGCDLRVVDRKRNNMLHSACFGGNEDIVKHLLSTKLFDKDSQGRDGKTPMLLALEEGHLRVLDILVDQGCSLTAVDDENNNMLHLASQDYDANVVEHLLKIPGVKKLTKRKNGNGQTPAEVAIDYDYTDIADLLNA